MNRSALPQAGRNERGQSAKSWSRSSTERRGRVGEDQETFRAFSTYSRSSGLLAARTGGVTYTGSQASRARQRAVAFHSVFSLVQSYIFVASHAHSS